MNKIRLLSFILLFLFSLACQGKEFPPKAPRVQKQDAQARQTPEAQQSTSTLRHIIILTGGAKADQRLPLIVALHGLGNSSEGFARLFTTFQQPARVLLPEGPLPARGQGHSWFRIRLTDGHLRLNEQQILEASEQIALLTNQIQKEKPTLGQPILTGFSQGGILSYALALHHPDSFSYVLPVAGWLPESLLPKEIQTEAAPRIRALHGEADPIVRYAPTKQLHDRLNKLGLDAKLKSYPAVRHTINTPMRAELFRLLGEAMKKNKETRHGREERKPGNPGRASTQR